MRFAYLLPINLLLIILFANGQAAAQAVPSSGPPASDSFFSPRPHQFDLEVANNFMLDDGSSLVRRREDSINGSALHLAGDLGVDTFQMPTLHLGFWFDELNAIEFQSAISRSTEASRWARRLLSMAT